MARQVIYDITRLALRTLRRTPNGIDRVDYSLARHFLDPGLDGSNAAALLTLSGLRYVRASRAWRLLQKLDEHWHESADPADDRACQDVQDWLRTKTAQLNRGRIPARGPALSDALSVWPPATIRGRALVATVPENAVYLNVSQFPVWVAPYFSWLRQRPDVSAVFFVHDLLPLETPEFFPHAEFERHKRRLDTIARCGAGAIVATQTVRSALQKHLAELGRKDMPILSLPIPAAEIFSRPRAPPVGSPPHPYFLVCATLEPRKNHAFLLHVWKELIRRVGMTAPKLVLVGARGWGNENALDLLARSHSLRSHVIHVGGLSTPGLKELMTRSRGLLMPSFAEGYGLPVVEALAAGVPVIAADIEVFREIDDARLTRVSPIDGEKWLTEILRLWQSGSSPALLPDPAIGRKMNWAAYFSRIQDFFENL